jgi:hypothetical protein
LGTAPSARKSYQAQPEAIKSRTVEPVHEIRLGDDAAQSFLGTAQKDRWDAATEDDTSSRSSTLDGEEDYMERIGKKPAPIQRLVPTKEMRNEEPRSPVPAPHVPGPLESQLAALMSKLIYLEHSNPAVSIDPQEYEVMQKRLKALEEEKKTWWKRHEAIWALRDEDVENNIKIRVCLP